LPPVLVVDVGCGTGTLLRRLADCLLLVPAMDLPLAHHGVGMGCANLLGIKPSREMLKEARKKFDPDHDGVGAAAPGAVAAAPTQR
jgi:hypothetical protein